MESFESVFESEKEIYNRDDSKILLVTSPTLEKPVIVK